VQSDSDVSATGRSCEHRGVYTVYSAEIYFFTEDASPSQPLVFERTHAFGAATHGAGQ
jgi:hypothetical protein